MKIQWNALSKPDKNYERDAAIIGAWLSDPSSRRIAEIDIGEITGVLITPKIVRVLGELDARQFYRKILIKDLLKLNQSGMS